jgi:hypothetical protein
MVCRGAPLHSADSIGYLIWIFQDIIVGYARGYVAWIHNEDTKGYCRIPEQDNKKDISYGYVSWISIGYNQDITRISYLDTIADNFLGYRTWIVKDIPGYDLDNCVGWQYGYLFWIYTRIQMDMTGYIKISCLDNFSWIRPQFIS